jgi:hypothetical protein
MSESIVETPTRRTVRTLFALYFLVLFATIMPPAFQVINRAEPFVMGLPFLLFWILFVSVMMSLGLIALYWVEIERGEIV